MLTFCNGEKISGFGTEKDDLSDRFVAQIQKCL